MTWASLTSTWRARTVSRAVRSTTRNQTARYAPGTAAGLATITTDLGARCCGFLLLLAAASEASPAAAQTQPPKAALIVTRGEGAQDCPDAAALAERVRGVAGANVLSSEVFATPFDTWVHVAVTRNLDGYSAQISTSGALHGNRGLQDLGPSCASLADAVAVTLAIFLDPYANAPPRKAAPVSCPPPAPVAEPKLHSGEPLPKRFFLEASAGVTLNVLEHAMPLLVGTAGLQLSPNWSLSLTGGVVLTDSTNSPGGEVDLSLTYVDFTACGRTLGESDRAQLNWCLGAMLGSLRGSGRGYADEFSKRDLWLSAGLGPEVLFPVAHSLFWVLRAEALFPVVRNGFDVRARGVQSLAFRPSAVAELISLGVRGEL
jgi:hypothetical protein